MNATLLGALFCIALWILFGFVRPIGLGVIHLLLPIGMVLLIRWYATRSPLNRLS
jgi:hypothetical protein